MTYDMAYTTDGKECVNHMGDNEFKTTLKWEGDDLVATPKERSTGTSSPPKTAGRSPMAERP
jgi:hypothetical protein